MTHDMVNLPPESSSCSSCLDLRLALTALQREQEEKIPGKVRKRPMDYTLERAEAKGSEMLALEIKRLELRVGEMCEAHEEQFIRADQAEAGAWQPIATYSDNGPVIVWNGQQSFLAYYQDPEGWFTDMDGELLRIDPPPTHFISTPKEATLRDSEG